MKDYIISEDRVNSILEALDTVPGVRHSDAVQIINFFKQSLIDNSIEGKEDKTEGKEDKTEDKEDKTEDKEDKIKD